MKLIKAVFAVPDNIYLINTAAHRKLLLRGLTILVAVLMVMIMLSYSIMAIILVPVYMYWLYFFYNFSKIWRVYKYSRAFLVIFVLIIAILGFAAAPFIRGFIGGLFI